MPSRRPHTKSRLGCRRCKEKHLKCDENQPICGACKRHGTICVPKTPNTTNPDLTTRPRSAKLMQSSEDPAISQCNIELVSAPTTLSTSDLKSPRTSLTYWEFKLLHHWMIHVSDDFSVTPNFHQAMRDQAVREAMRHDFLLHVILMISSLHLAHTNSPDFTPTHLAFITAGCTDAMARFRQEANSINNTNFGAVQAFPFFLSIYALALPQLDRDESREEMVLDEIVHILGLIQANKIVHEQTDHWKKQNVVNSWIDDADVWDDRTAQSGNFGLGYAVAKMQTWVDASSGNDRIRFINAQAAQALVDACHIDMKLTLRPLLWPNMIHTKYIDLLIKRDSVAMIILAYYAVILETSNSGWWYSGWGTRLIRSIATLLPDGHTEVMAYPLDIISR